MLSSRRKIIVADQAEVEPALSGPDIPSVSAGSEGGLSFLWCLRPDASKVQYYSDQGRRTWDAGMAEPKYDEAELAELREEMRAAETARESWAQRWLLSLGVANAGALLATASVMLDPSKRTWMIVPSAWFFLAGLVLAGVIPVFAVARYDNLAQVRWSQTRSNRFNIRYNGKEVTEEEFRSEVMDKAKIYRRFTRMLSAASAILFIIGATAGLILLSKATLLSPKVHEASSSFPPLRSPAAP